AHVVALHPQRALHHFGDAAVVLDDQHTRGTVEIAHISDGRAKCLCDRGSLTRVEAAAGAVAPARGAAAPAPPAPPGAARTGALPEPRGRKGSVSARRRM